MVMAKLRAMLREEPPVSAPPDTEMVTFDPADGKKRVLIVVGADGMYESPRWWNMAGMLAGEFEAGMIASRGAHMIAEDLSRRVHVPAAAEELSDGQ